MFRVASRLAASPASKFETKLLGPADSAAWQHPELTAQRLQEVVAHQNALRSAQGLPLLDVGAERHATNGATVFVTRSQGHLDGDESTAGVFHVWGDALMRCVYGDLFSLNHVYRFDQARLLNAQSYGEWVLDRAPAATVALFRDVSAEELARWRQHDFEHLGAAWGHQVNHQPVNVMFFSSDAHQTSAPGKRAATLELRVPKTLLLSEAKRGALWSAATHFPDEAEPKLISEFVFEPSVARQSPFIVHERTGLPPSTDTAAWAPKT